MEYLKQEETYPTDLPFSLLVGFGPPLHLLRPNPRERSISLSLLLWPCASCFLVSLKFVLVLDFLLPLAARYCSARLIPLLLVPRTAPLFTSSNDFLLVLPDIRKTCSLP